jgi:crossover junction endodeoxyribonuclease RuvC
MRILGIDPGLQTTGFGVIDMEGQRLSYVASGTIRTNKMELGDLPGRLKVLFDGISEVAARYQPEVASVEIVFVNVNPQSTLLLGQARGAALTALVNANLAVSEYTALQMKKPWSVMVAQPEPDSGNGQTAAATARPAWYRCRRRAGTGHHPCPCGCRHGADGQVHRSAPQATCHVPGRTGLLSQCGPESDPLRDPGKHIGLRIAGHQQPTVAVVLRKACGLAA